MHEHAKKACDALRLAANLNPELFLGAPYQPDLAWLVDDKEFDAFLAHMHNQVIKSEKARIGGLNL